MKDLVPKGTGNSRLLRSSIPADITFTEMVTMLRNGTFPVDFAGLNSAGVAVVGSAYNKANVLPDDVCTALGVPTSAEPKDAFAKLSSCLKSYKLLEKITASKSWACPDGVFKIVAIIVGAGGGGGRSDSKVATGGQGGRAIITGEISVTPGNSYQIVIGAGGAGGTSSSDTSGGKGGTTTAFGFNAVGGNGGNGNGEAVYDPFAGSQSGQFGGDSKNIYGSGNDTAAKYGSTQVFTDLEYTDWYSAGGAPGNGYNSSTERPVGGPHGGLGGIQNDTAGTAGDDGYGAGGGGGYWGGNSGVRGNGGRGGNGAVLIYSLR